MHSQSLLVLFCTLFSLVSLSAADIQKRSFAVERVRNPSFTGRNGPRALVKTYRKFNMALPQGLLDAMAAQEAAAAAAVQQKRDTTRRFTYVGRSEAHRRGLVSDLLTSLGLEVGNQNGGRQNGGGQAGNGNRNGNKGGRNGNQNGNLGSGGQTGNGGNRTDVANGGNRNGGSRNGGNRNNGNGNAIGGGGGNARNTTAQAPHGNSTNQVGSVPALPEKNDVEFISPVKIGGQTVNLDFDTGSSDLWVFNKQLAPALAANHRIFDAAKSASFKPMQGATFRISYGDGSGAQGNVGTDVVDVGGASFANQAVELATAVTQQFVMDQGSDGLMGLAFSQINTVKPQKQKTFFENIKADLAEPVFTADLRKNAPGTYSFGTIDRTKFQGELTWIPVNTTKGFWQFSSESFAVNGGQAQPSTSGGQGIADTGTTLILADAKAVTAYYAQVQGAQNNPQVGGFTFPCNAQLPDLALDVGNVYMAKISGNDINFAQVGGGSKCFLQFPPISIQFWCKD